MSELVADCPRCGANKITFDLKDEILLGRQFEWQHVLEVFCVCRNCEKSTVFLVTQSATHSDMLIRNGLKNFGGAVNQFVDVKRFIGIQDNQVRNPPAHLPENIDAIFKEGMACLAIGCNNAAATMFRLCLDLATKSLLPEEDETLNNRIRRNLGLRLPWLFEHQILPIALEDLSSCIKDDGNDGAHEGILNEAEAADILDFTFILLERLYTEPKRLEIAAERRAERRTK